MKESSYKSQQYSQQEKDETLRLEIIRMVLSYTGVDTPSKVIAVSEELMNYVKEKLTKNRCEELTLDEKLMRAVINKTNDISYRGMINKSLGAIGNNGFIEILSTPMNIIIDNPKTISEFIDCYSAIQSHKYCNFGFKFKGNTRLKISVEVEEN